MVVIDVLVGEDDEVDVPAVAAVAPDFQSALPVEAPEPPVDGPGGRADEEVEVLPGPEALKPKFRDRWRARRKARRAARGRRLITIRTVLFVVILAGILYAAYFAVHWYDTNAYYVQIDNNELMIYHGRIGGGVLYKPVLVERTGDTTADVPQYALSELETGVQEDSLKSARAYVANLVAAQQATVCAQNPATPGCTTGAGLPTTSTTVAP